LASSIQISIILPLLNGESHLPGFLERLAMQQSKNFELVVMDGGSTDGGLQLIKSFESKTGIPTSIYSNNGSSIYASMNAGIAATKLNWLYFTGCDDRFYDNKITAAWAKEMEILPEADIIYGNVMLKSNGSEYRGVTNLFDLLNKGNICHQAILYNRNVFNVVGVYNDYYPIWADWDLNIRCFQHPNLRVRFIPDTIAVYNDLEGSSKIEDPVFRQLLPLCQKADLEKELNQLKQLFSYRLGKKLFGWLDSLQRKIK
jgi:glycosyltransferase involved in cell wall biosynthesis